LKLSKIYELAVKYGIQQDPRGKDISGYFQNIKKEYRKLKGIERITFDKESLTNPFSDTRLLYGNPDSEINKILVGIDIETAEILLADRIRERQGLDLALSHHPEGIAYAGLSEVMRVQGYILNKLGLHKEAVSDSLKERVQEVARKILPANHSRPVDAARLLNIPFMSCHTPADNFVAKYLQENINKGRPKTLKDILNYLNKIPEYKEAAFNKAGPRIILGKPKDKAGKVFVDMTGGTEGPKELFGRLSQAGINTLVCMHLSEEHFSKAKPEHINVVIAGHIASDNLGMNLLLDKIETHEKLDILCCSGFKRIKR